MATELTPMPEDWERALAIVAHPDDMEYGASGAVAAWTAAGKQVTYLMVTRGEAGIDGIPPQQCAPIREAEQRASAEVVGVAVVEFLDHPDGMVEYGLPLRRDLSAAIRRHRPDLVITGMFYDKWGPNSWNSADHRAVGRAVVDAVDDAGNRWIFPELTGQGLEPHRVRYVALAGSPESSHAVDVSGTLDRAVASLKAHETYLAGLGSHAQGDPAEFLTEIASWLAPRFGGRPAIGFELLIR